MERDICEAIPPSPHGVPRTSLFCSAYRLPRKILLAYQILCARLLASNMSHMHVEMPYKHGPMINVCYRAYPVLLMLFLLFMKHVCTSIRCAQQRRHSSLAWRQSRGRALFISWDWAIFAHKGFLFNLNIKNYQLY